jgi:hypothetical protein
MLAEPEQYLFPVLRYLDVQKAPRPSANLAGSHLSPGRLARSTLVGNHRHRLTINPYLQLPLAFPRRNHIMRGILVR